MDGWVGTGLPHPIPPHRDTPHHTIPNQPPFTHREALAGKVVVDVSNPLGSARYLAPPLEGKPSEDDAEKGDASSAAGSEPSRPPSHAEALAAALDGRATVVKALNNLSARALLEAGGPKGPRCA